MNEYNKPKQIDALIRKQLKDLLERAGRDAGYGLATKYLSCETGHKFTILTAPIERDEVPTEAELSEGVDVLLTYLSLSDETRLKPGFYVIRIATPSYSSKDQAVSISFINLHGETALNLQGKKTELDEGDLEEVANFDELISASNSIFLKLCGVKKCLVIKRLGFLHWKFGCVDKHTGHVVNCVG